MKTARILALLLALCCLCLAACGGAPAGTDTANASPEPSGEAPAPAESTAPAISPQSAPIPDGVYTVDVDTDSSMFHLNEATEGKGTLTVENGKMTVHISMPSKKIENIFFGSAADAAKEGAQLLQPTLDTVTYKDGESEEVYGFDIPVPYLDEEFGCAIIGTHGNWYDHKISVSNPVPAE